MGEHSQFDLGWPVLTSSGHEVDPEAVQSFLLADGVAHLWGDNKGAYQSRGRAAIHVQVWGAEGLCIYTTLTLVMLENNKGACQHRDRAAIHVSECSSSVCLTLTLTLTRTTVVTLTRALISVERHPL